MIDLRSDTVTQPCAEMRAAMLEAPLGDDVYGDDPTVNLLEATLAERAGKEAGLFLASGTQSNLCALLSHCGRGDEYIAGQDAHTYQYEAGGAAVLGGIQPQPIPWNERGELALQDIQRVIKPDDIHFARTKLLCLENTVGGKTVSLDYTHQATSLARNHNLNCHLDGARVFNAAEKLKIDVKEICQPFDSISICLSKGLGAPAGSVLVGDADFIQRARRWRKMLGGGMRQAGILAAAGLYALTHNVARLAEDHENARVLGEALSKIPGFSLAEPVQTNMVFLALEGDPMSALTSHLAEHRIKISGARWVLHKDVSAEHLKTIITACEAFAAERR